MLVFGAALLFAVVVSVDLFACGLAYGLGGVRVGFWRALVVNLTGTCLLAPALFAGFYAGAAIPDAVGTWVGFGVLMAVAGFKIVSHFTRHHNRGGVGEIISPTITFAGAIVVGLSSSIDGVAMSFGTTIAGMPLAFVFAVIAIMAVTDQAVVMGSNALGRAVARRRVAHGATIRTDLVVGVTLAVIATAKLFVELFA